MLLNENIRGSTHDFSNIAFSRSKGSGEYRHMQGLTRAFPGLQTKSMNEDEYSDQNLDL